MYSSPKTAARLLMALGILPLLWLAWRYVLPAAAPFAAAYVLALAMEPAVRFLCRRGLGREAASGVGTLALLAALIALGYFALRGGAWLVSRAAELLPGALGLLAGTAAALRDALAGRFGELSPELSAWADASFASLTGYLAALPAELSARLIAQLTSAASRAPGALIFAVSCGIGVYFISASLPDIQTFLDTRLPERWLARRLRLRRELRDTLWRYLRAQLILAALVFALLLPGLWLLRVKGAWLVALVTAAVDALPVFGSGAVLLPWAAAAILTGDAPLGLGLLILWGAATLLRNCVQPKLLGDQLGLHPLLALAALYVGWYLGGVAGMVLLPIIALLAQRFIARPD